MTNSPEIPPRPQPPRRVSDTLQGWFAWFGLARLLLSAVCVLAVVAGVAWLVRTPPPPTEAALPTTRGAAPASTLPVPSTVAPTVPESTSEPASPSLLVHVAGAVRSTGVYELDAAARVHDAIDAAGGPSADADLDGLNLAATVVDGQRVYVPVAGEVDPASVPTGGGDDTAAGSTAAPAGPPAPVDLNAASAAELETLPGVGPATAAAIVDDRERHGPFASVDELERVPGIGPAKLAAVADLVTV